MHPMIDLAMIKHHRVSYAPRLDKDAARKQPAYAGRVAALCIVVFVAPLLAQGVI